MSRQLASILNSLSLVGLSEQGQGLTEYVFLVGLIAITLMLSVSVFGLALQGSFFRIVASMP